MAKMADWLSALRREKGYGAPGVSVTVFPWSGSETSGDAPWIIFQVDATGRKRTWPELDVIRVPVWSELQGPGQGSSKPEVTGAMSAPPVERDVVPAADPGVG